MKLWIKEMARCVSLAILTTAHQTRQEVMELLLQIANNACLNIC